MSNYYKVKGYEPSKPKTGARRLAEPYQLIALDIDGTLTNSEKEISPKTKEALLDAQKRGLRLILASGRPPQGLKRLANELEMDKHHGILLALNGGNMSDAQTGELLFERTLDYDLAVDLINHLRQFDVCVMTMNGDKLYTENKNGFKVDYEAGINDLEVVEVENLVDAIHFNVPKILVAGDPDYLRENLEAIKKPFENDTSNMFSAPFYYEFSPKGINKSTALHGLLLKLGIAPGDLMAFGDAQNDTEMLELAGMGVAMGNASPDLKEIADFITKSNDQDGVGYAVETFTE